MNRTPEEIVKAIRQRHARINDMHQQLPQADRDQLPTIAMSDREAIDLITAAGRSLTIGCYTIIRVDNTIILRHYTGEAMQCDVAEFAAAVEIFYTERF